MKVNFQSFLMGVAVGAILIPVLSAVISLPFSVVQKALTDINSFLSAGTCIAAVVAAYYAYKTWGLERLPVVHAVGTFIISTGVETNNLRDRSMIKQDSPHTLQVVNVGRGPAKNVTPSVRRDATGKFLEDSNPHSFALPANKGTKELKEILRVHGQRFVAGDEYELEFEDNRKTGWFYIYFEDYEGKRYLTRVKIDRVGQADGELGNLVRTPGIEVWKVMDNITEK